MFIQKHIKSIITAIIVAIALYLVSAIILGWDESIALVNKITATGWLSLIACSFTSYLIRYGRWSYFIKKLGYVIPHKQHFLYYLSGFALTVTPAKIGETIRSLYLFKHGVSYTKSISAFFIERLLDLTVVTIISSLLLFQHNEYQFFIIVLLITILVLILLLKSNYFQSILKFCKNYSNSKIITKFEHNIKLLLEHSKTLLYSPALSIGLISGFIAWSIQGTAFYLLLTQLEFNITIFSAISIYSIALISGALSFVPGGIGSTEIVMGVFLYYFGAPKEIVVIAPIIIRITSLWFAVLIGLISTIIISKNINNIKSKTVIPR